jgi:hypothetical protein
MGVMMLGGPYSGQNIKAPLPRWTRDYQRIPYLVNVWSGKEVHCYRTERAPSGTWYLFYRESF